MPTSPPRPHLPSNTLVHGIPPGASSKKSELALLKSRAAILFTALFLPHKIWNSTILQSLHPMLPPNHHYCDQLFLISNNKVAHPSLSAPLTTCLRKLSSTHCRNHLDLAWLAILQQISGMVKLLPNACKKPHPLAPPDQAAYTTHPQHYHLC